MSNHNDFQDNKMPEKRREKPFSEYELLIYGLILGVMGATSYKISNGSKAFLVIAIICLLGGLLMVIGSSFKHDKWGGNE